MRFMFRKKRYKHEKSIDDLKKEYDKNGEYRHIVVNDKIFRCGVVKQVKKQSIKLQMNGF